MKFKLVGEGNITRRGRSILKTLAPYHETVVLQDFFEKYNWANKAIFYVERFYSGRLIGLIRQSPHRIILMLGNRIATDHEAATLSPIICSKENFNLLEYISQFLIVWAKYSLTTRNLHVVDVWDKAKFSWANSKLKKRWCKQMKIPLAETVAILKHPQSQEILKRLVDQFNYPITLKASYKGKTFIINLMDG
jgi:hypothetical protein